MLDLHNHVLPGVDDGAANLRVALSMLEQAAEQGITHVACTPHLNERMTAEVDRHFQSVFLQLEQAVAGAGVPVQLMLGSEIMLGGDLQRLLTYKVSSYGGKRGYFLLEFPASTPHEIAINAIRVFRRHHMQPVLAHIERFIVAVKSVEHAAALRAAGAVLSIDAGALTGQFGPTMVSRAKQLVRAGCIDLMMSDAHDDHLQTFCLKPAFDVAVELIGEAEARRLVDEHPRRVWNNEPWPHESELKDVI
ncbi:hypothetical protein HZB60_07085 [candidate division KSB1 bacterium]|nr:hypothetical protein [candidate division KSB1 bacterium]